jgi:hypothetical protein
MTTYAVVALVCFAFFVLVMFLFHISGEYLYTYRVSNTGVEFLLFKRVPIARIRFANITAATVVSRGESLKKGLHLNVINRFSRQFVLLKRRGGVFPAILLSPREPEQFVADVSKHLPG